MPSTTQTGREVVSLTAYMNKKTQNHTACYCVAAYVPVSSLWNTPLLFLLLSSLCPSNCSSNETALAPWAAFLFLRYSFSCLLFSLHTPHMFFFPFYSYTNLFLHIPFMILVSFLRLIQHSSISSPDNDRIPSK